MNLAQLALLAHLGEQKMKITVINDDGFTQGWIGFAGIMIAVIGIMFRGCDAPISASVKTEPEIKITAARFQHLLPPDPLPVVAIQPEPAPTPQPAIVEPAKPEQPKSVEVYKEFILEDNPKLGQKLALKLAEKYVELEKKYELPIGLLPAVASRESNHKPSSVSSKGAYGLMQVQVETGFDAAKRLGHIPTKTKPEQLYKHQAKVVRMLKDPQQNVELGANTLANYLERSKGNIKIALAHYSNGAGNYYGPIKEQMREIQSRLSLN
jgi:hypothetical protein